MGSKYFKRLRFPEYYIVILLSLVVSVVALMAGHGEALNNVVWLRGNDLYMDFFNHISYSTVEGWSNVYLQGYNACFPPLPYIAYGLFGKMLPMGSTVIASAAETSPYAMLLYTLRCILLGIFYYYAFIMIFRKPRQSLALAMTTLVSHVFIFGALERGNSAWLVCTLLLAAMAMKDSPSRVKREAALILIAVAAAFKIYPALFGLLYLVERRWKESVRLMIYGILLFFVPFAFFGGIEGFKQFLTNQQILHSGSTSMGNVFWMAKQIRGLLKVDLHYYRIGIVLVTLLSCAGLVVLKEKWKKLMLICGMMILLPKWSGIYTVFYFVIPLCVFMLEAEVNALNRVRSVLFAGIFALVLYGSSWTGYYVVSYTQTAIQYLCIWAFMITLYIEVIINGWKYIKKMKQTGLLKR